MKNYFILYKSSALVGMLMLSCGLYSCHTRTDSNSSSSAAPPAVATAPAGPVQGARIAYINIDSLEANYNFLKDKKEELRAQQDAMESEMQRAYQQMQNDADQVQKKLNDNTMTEAEYKSAQMRLGQMQRSFETKKQALTDQLVKKQEDFQKEIKTRLDDFLAEYNKDKKYDYILSYGSGSNILYANSALDITADVIKGMNERSKILDKKTDKK